MKKELSVEAPIHQRAASMDGVGRLSPAPDWGARSIEAIRAAGVAARACKGPLQHHVRKSRRRQDFQGIAQAGRGHGCIVHERALHDKHVLGSDAATVGLSRGRQDSSTQSFHPKIESSSWPPYSTLPPPKKCAS